MSLEKAIEHGKEHRRQYVGREELKKASSCREYNREYEEDRLHNEKVKELDAEEQEAEAGVRE